MTRTPLALAWLLLLPGCDTHRAYTPSYTYHLADSVGYYTAGPRPIKLFEKALLSGKEPAPEGVCRASFDVVNVRGEGLMPSADYVLAPGKDGKVYAVPLAAADAAASAAATRCYPIGTQSLKAGQLMAVDQEVEVHLDAGWEAHKDEHAFLLGSSCSYYWTAGPLPAPVDAPEFFDLALSPDPDNAPDPLPAPRSLSPVPGRVYVYSGHFDAGPYDRNTVEVVAVADDTLTFNLLREDSSGSAPLVRTKGVVVKKLNGVYWPLQDPNPVLREIESYPSTYAFSALGPLKTRAVWEADGRRSWFADGVLVQRTSFNLAGVGGASLSAVK